MDIHAPEKLASEEQSNPMKSSVWAKFDHFLKRNNQRKEKKKRQEQLSLELLKFGERKSKCIMKRKMS